jgi:protein ImuB
VKTLGAFAALPAGEVYERLGARGVRWQRLARGEDTCPLVPWIPEDPFEGVLTLEWPIEGLEPLSFVLGRLLEPLSERLERADRAAAVLHTHLRLVSKTVHARTLALPAPMRDPKTLRTLVLLDLESNPPSAAVDEVRLLIEPTPAREVQWMLYERAQPSPEQTATLLARLTALMGEGHVGSPQLVDSWKPGQFALTSFTVRPGNHGQGHKEARGTQDSPVETLPSALRRFRLPVPVRVQVSEGRPVRVMSDRRSIVGGAVVQAAGPWRTSGEWWNDQPAPKRLSAFAEAPTTPKAGPTCWDRDEWDAAMADGTVYRLYVERDVGQWFLDGVVD